MLNVGLAVPALGKTRGTQQEEISGSSHPQIEIDGRLTVRSHSTYPYRVIRIVWFRPAVNAIPGGYQPNPAQCLARPRVEQPGRQRLNGCAIGFTHLPVQHGHRPAILINVAAELHSIVCLRSLFDIQLHGDTGVAGNEQPRLDTVERRPGRRAQRQRLARPRTSASARAVPGCSTRLLLPIGTLDWRHQR